MNIEHTLLSYIASLGIQLGLYIEFDEVYRKSDNFLIAYTNHRLDNKSYLYLWDDTVSYFVQFNIQDPETIQNIELHIKNNLKNRYRLDDK